jgi:hypothetical protein
MTQIDCREELRAEVERYKESVGKFNEWIYQLSTNITVPFNTHDLIHHIKTCLAPLTDNTKEAK